MTSRYRELKLGRTVARMRLAPRGAVFIWKSEDLTYPRYLARKHRREDLNILPLSAAADNFLLFRRAASLPTGIVLDHEVKLDRRARRALKYLCVRIRRAAETRTEITTLANEALLRSMTLVDEGRLVA